MRYLILCIILLISVFFIGLKDADPLPAETPAYQQDQSNIGFEWAFGALVGKDNVFVPITRDTVLKSGEEIKMMVKLTKDCFVYLIHYGSKGEIDLLFPYEFRQFQKDYEIGKNYYIPKGRTWNSLDKNIGKEVFFLIASTERLLDIEAKVGDYLSADTAKKSALAENLVSEIRNVRKRYATFATIAEKPLTIGGNIRAIAKTEETKRPDVADIATQITANNFYSKTFTIDHQ